MLKVLEDNVNHSGQEGTDGIFGIDRMQEKQLQDGKQVINSYLCVLLKDTIYHKLRQFLAVEWDPVEQKELRVFFEKWENLLPVNFYSHVLSAYLVPKLEQKVQNFTVKDLRGSSIYGWVSPWLENEKLATYCPQDSNTFRVSLRLKLAQFIKEWTPENNLLTSEIKKFKPIYEESSWNNLISGIVAKLSRNLKKLKINPHDQEIEPINSVLKWKNFINPKTLTVIFKENFIMNWLKVLVKWTQMEKPDFIEINDWYQGWTHILPPTVVEDESIQVYLKAALILINSKIQ